MSRRGGSSKSPKHRPAATPSKPRKRRPTRAELERALAAAELAAKEARRQASRERKRAYDREYQRRRREEAAKDPTTWTWRKLHRWYPDADPDDIVVVWTSQLRERGIDPNEIRDPENDPDALTWGQWIADQLDLTTKEVYDAWLSPP